MSGRIFRGILLLLVLFVACFLASPISSGEHPWGQDRGGDGDGEGYLPTVTNADSTGLLDTGIVIRDVTTDSDGAADVTSMLTSILTSIWSSLSAAF